MNLFRLPFLVVLAAVAFNSSISAQSSAGIQGETAFVSNTSASGSRSGATANISSAYRFSKKLPVTYTGYAIEVAASEYPLQRDNPVFRQFGNIFYEKLKEGGYSYVIKAEFSSKEAAHHFIQTIIAPRVPEARLFEYKEGNRKILRG